MKNDKLDGEATAYFEDGKIRNKSIFKDGVKLEEEVYKDNEIIKNTFRNSEIIQQDTYSKNKKLVLRKNLLNDGKIEYISYYENGVIKEKAYFINDKQEKEHLYYDEKGNLIKTEIYKNGVKQ